MQCSVILWSMTNSREYIILQKESLLLVMVGLFTRMSKRKVKGEISRNNTAVPL